MVAAERAQKSLNAQAGAAVDAKVGEHPGKVLAFKVPFGGLEFVKKTSTQSFNNLDDDSVYSHVMCGGTAEHDKALAAAMAIYPAHENGYDASVRRARPIHKVPALSAQPYNLCGAIRPRLR